MHVFPTSLGIDGAVVGQNFVDVLRAINISIIDTMFNLTLTRIAYKASLSPKGGFISPKGRLFIAEGQECFMKYFISIWHHILYFILFKILRVYN